MGWEQATYSNKHLYNPNILSFQSQYWKEQSSRLLEMTHFLDYSAFFSSPPMLLTIWEDSQDSHQSPLPTKEIPSNTSSPGFAGFATNCQGSPCLTLDEGESCSPPRHWDAGHRKSRPAPGLGTSTPLGTWRCLVCRSPLVILDWHMQGKKAQHILDTW